MSEPTNQSSTYFFFKNDQLLIKDHSDTLILPNHQHITLEHLSDYSPFKIHSDDDNIFYLIDVNDTFTIPDNLIYVSMRDIRAYHTHDLYSHIAGAYQLNNWHRQHKYCGVCGTMFNQMNVDKSIKCPGCDHLLFPQTSVAVIIGILKDDKILLAHNANFPDNLYSLIAGFVEMGENFEEAVRREIKEEVGLSVKNIRYFGNQPWPFPNSTMVGFFADWDSGEIEVDGVEIIDANWYTPDNFPTIPSGSSIARKIIEHYRKSIYSGQ